MYGAILGDMIGSPYEFDQGGKSKEFPLFIESSHFTDDTVMTVAVADAPVSYTHLVAVQGADRAGFPVCEDRQGV